MNMYGHHLRYDLDFTTEEIWRVFELTKDLKRRVYTGEPHELLKGKSLAMIFAKPSTHTRVSFEVGMTQLGGHALYLGPNDLQLSRGETVADTARVLSRFVNGIMARVFTQNEIEELAAHATVPVINGLSDMYHPCQALTDLFTVLEKRQALKGLTMCFIGDGDNNVTNSLMLLSARLGINFTVAAPKQYMTQKYILSIAKKEAIRTGAKITLTNDPIAAVQRADIIHTDVWVSMGRTDVEERKKILAPYQVNEKLIKKAPAHALVMHCLPAHRGEEITDDVIDSPRSIVFDQAENRLHVQKAIMALLMK
ncbi:MAG: ornithine carbamoyltransferase [Candidatus Gottesmanbacteria bacterium]